MSRMRKQMRLGVRTSACFQSTKALIAAITAVTFATALLECDPAGSEQPEIAARRSAERTDFTNAEIGDGFFKVAFGSELQTSANADRIRKFDGPARVFLDNRANANRRADLAAVVADIKSHVANLDLAMTDDRNAANIIVILVRDHTELGQTIRARYGATQAKAIERRLTPQCLSGFAEGAGHRIRRAEILLIVGKSDFDFLDCAYEELLQALGPINDDSSVPWTMFNDQVRMGFFDIYDQYLLNILYDPQVRPGMTRQQVLGLLPDILPGVRSWIVRINGLPGGQAHNDPAAFVGQ
jgi:hypothetical protein